MRCTEFISLFRRCNASLFLSHVYLFFLFLCLLRSCISFSSLACITRFEFLSSNAFLLFALFNCRESLVWLPRYEEATPNPRSSSCISDNHESSWRIIFRQVGLPTLICMERVVELRVIGLTFVSVTRLCSALSLLGYKLRWNVIFQTEL
jgi:hypothetical protein